MMNGVVSGAGVCDESTAGQDAPDGRHRTDFGDGGVAGEVFGDGGSASVIARTRDALGTYFGQGLAQPHNMFFQRGIDCARVAVRAARMGFERRRPLGLAV